MFELYEEPPREAVLYFNHKSRQGADWFESTRKWLEDSPVNIRETRSFSSSLEMQDAVEAQVASRVPMVILGGGDGTISSVVRHFANSDTVLGVIPCGTGNALARDLGLPVEVEGACEVLLNGKVASIDMGIIGDRQFLNVATIGLTGQIAGFLEPNLKRIFGKAIYLLSVIRALSTVEPFLVKLELLGSAQSFECLQLVIGNGHFHAGPFPISPDAQITGGHLAVYALATRDKRAFIKLALWMQNGRHVDLEEVKYFRTKSGFIDTVPAQDFIADGERCSRTPQHFRVSERALKVIVPQGFHV